MESRRVFCVAHVLVGWLVLYWPSFYHWQWGLQVRLAAICDPFSKHSHRRKNKWYCWWKKSCTGISEPSTVVGIEPPQLWPFSHVSWDVGPPNDGPNFWRFYFLRTPRLSLFKWCEIRYQGGLRIFWWFHVFFKQKGVSPFIFRQYLHFDSYFFQLVDYFRRAKIQWFVFNAVLSRLDPQNSGSRNGWFTWRLPLVL